MAYEPDSPSSPSPICKGSNVDSDNSSGRPNIILILADDLGFSDVGCYGSEISTPNIDYLASSSSSGGGGAGVRFSQMYNCARCCPTRASILTGRYPHGAGVGHMVYDAGVGPEYQGYLRGDVRTIAEMLRDGGVAPRERLYDTCMVGKWHVGGEYPPDASDEWTRKTMGDESHPTPTQRGFDEYYGTLGGGGSYYRPPSLVENDEVVNGATLPDGYYYTDAISDRACSYIDCRGQNDGEDHRPFFMYVSYTAPHWPLHAPETEIDKYRGKYMRGWDKVRADRHAKLVGEGMIPSAWECSPRDENSPPWDEVPDKEWEDARMATYAAQITIMDQGIGRIVHSLRRNGLYDNTVIFFLSDNGGCAEYLKENGEEGNWLEFYGGITRSGQKIEVGNLRHLKPGGEETFMSYDLPWANASNAPFRLFKSFVHEGGIATPFVVHWPRRLSDGNAKGETNEDNSLRRICNSPWVVMDIVATCLDIAGIEIPDHLDGESFLPVLLNDDAMHMKRRNPIFWEHQGNRAVRLGKWKLVHQRTCNKSRNSEATTDSIEWELYDMDEDRTELHNLAFQLPEKVLHMSQLWREWATQVGVKPWPLQPLPEGEKDWSNLPWMW